MKGVVPFDKPSFWSELKRRFLQNRYVEALFDWQSRRRIRKYRLGLQLNRRHFLLGLVLAPFTPIPRDPVEIRQLIVSEYLKTIEGRRQLAMSMIAPIRRPLDYAQLSRSLIPVQQLPNGALPIYDKDPGVAKIVTGSDDESV